MLFTVEPVKVILLDLTFKMELNHLIKLNENIMINDDTVFDTILDSFNINFHP